MRKLKLATVLVTVAALVLVGTAVMAQSTGTLSGRVLDANGEAIPGASVVVTSSQLQGPRGTATNVDGQFTLPYLPPASDYTLTIEATNYNKVVRSGLTISLGATSTVEVRLALQGKEVVVKGQPPAVSLKKIKISTNLSSEELNTLPLGRSYQDVLYLAPTVTGSGMGGNPGVAGSTGTENIFMINGLNTTDPVTGTFGTNLNFNFVREMEVDTGAMDAEYGASTGGLFNVLTKSGSNEFHGEVFAYYNDDSFNARAHSNDFSVNSNQPYHNYDYGFDIGGPIVKDRLWFFVGYNPSLYTTHHEGNYQTTNLYPWLSGYRLRATIPYKYDDLSKSWFWSAKFNYRINDKHNLEFSVFSDPSQMWYNEGAFPSVNQDIPRQVNFHANATNPSHPYADFTWPTSTGWQPGMATRRYQGGYNAILRWYASWSPNFFSETAFGKTHSRLDILPWDESGYGEVYKISADWSPAISVGDGSGTVLWDDRDSSQFQTKETWLVGNHEIKFGGQYEYLKWNSYNDYTGGEQMNLYYNFSGKPFNPKPAAYYYADVWSNQNPRSYEKGYYTAAFAQDKWSINDYLDLSYGVRWEKNEVKPDNGGDELSVTSWSPRLGITYDFMHNGKSKIYANWGIYSMRTPIAVAQSMDPGHATYEDLYNFGANPQHYTYGATPTFVQGGVKNQYNTEWVVGAEYELRPDLTVGLRAVYRYLGRILEDVGYIDKTGNISYVLMNPGEQWPAFMDRWRNYVPDYERFPKAIRNYQGYTLTLNKRFSNNWFLKFDYTWSQLKGNYEGGSGGYSIGQLNPMASAEYDVPESCIIKNRYGYLPQDIRHSIKAQGSYRFDHGWMRGLVLGGVFTYHSGRPLNKYYGYPYREFGYGTLLAAPRGSNRLPGIWQLDMHAEYDIKLWDTTLALFADIFNVTNRQTATSKYSNYYNSRPYFSDPLVRDPNWGLTTGRQTSRHARMGIRWSF